MIIEKATLSDLNDLVTMGRDFFYEAEWDKLYEWNDSSAAIALTNLINNPDGIVYLAKKENQSIGMASALLYPIWYNTDIITAQEFFFYVMPEYRKGTGHLLKTEIENEAQLRGARTMVFGSVEGMPSLNNYYARTGYIPSEHTFIKRL